MKRGNNKLTGANSGLPLKAEVTFHIERLEPRYMLSGNVIASLLGADLWIQGDELDNDLSLEIVNDQVVLVGNADTTINGSSNTFIVSESAQIEGDLFVNLRRGDDQFVINDGIQASGSVHIRTGSGDDVVGIQGLQVDGRTKVVTGSGNDSIAISDLQADQLKIRTGSGADLVSLVDSQVAGRAVLRTGSGDDSVVAQSLAVDGDLSAVSGAGNDDLVIENGQITGSLLSRSGAGDDVVRLEDSTISGRTLLFQNQGNDSAQVLGNTQLAGESAIFGGSGDDQQEVADAVTSSEEIRVFSFATDSTDATSEARIDAESTGAVAQSSALQASLFAAPEVTPPTPEVASLTLDTSGNTVIQSNGVEVVREPDFLITGQTTAGALIELDRDGDGLFNDGTVTADASGDFELDTVLLASNDFGPNQLNVRATTASGSQTTQAVAVYYAVGTVVRYDTSLGSFDLELLDEDAPVTVQNFTSYIGDDFENSIIHRSPGTGFVIQGGGFTVDNDVVSTIETRDPIASEFNPNNSNLRGTLSTALLSGNPDSATSGFFINTSDNSFLDAAGHTVFGRVIGDGLDVVDAIDQLPNFDLSSLVNPAFGELPLRDYQPFTNELTGTLSATVGDTTIVGNGTAFESELVVGQALAIDDQVFTVAAIVSDTSLIIAPTVQLLETIDQQVGLINSVPEDENYVFIDINVL